MIFLMAISLFTTRVNLQALGVDDYGIYNVVGGIVALFAILSQSLSSACSRFLNYEMGRGRQEQLKKVFSTSMTIQIVLAIVIAILSDTIGYWFLNTKMVIPVDRLSAANWVLQFSILTFCINLIGVPYNATIIAHEKMSAFAFISIYEGVAKLLVCYLIMVSTIDKLILYAALLCFIQVTTQLIYWGYCTKHFYEAKYNFSYDKNMMKEMFSFTGWNYIGASSMIIRTHGGNILINLFAGPTINAARGIANQIKNAVTGFTYNFMIAVNPQITKSYASKDYQYMNTLVSKSAKFSLFLLFLLTCPIMLNVDYILSIWLKEVPEATDDFAVLTLVFAICESLSSPLITTQMATGKVRNYQLIVGGINLLNIPISYFLFLVGFPPIFFLIVAIVLSIVCLFARLILVQKNAGLQAYNFIKDVLVRGGITCVFAIILPLIHHLLTNPSFINFIANSLLCIICTSVSVYCFGCSSYERLLLSSKIKKIINV